MEERSARLDVRLRPRPFDQLLVLQVDNIGLDMALLLVVLVQHSKGRHVLSVEELDVLDEELIEPQGVRFVSAGRDDAEFRLCWRGMRGCTWSCPCTLQLHQGGRQ